MTAETTINTRGAQRLATLEALRVELHQRLTPIEGGPLDGIHVVSKGEIDQAIANVKAQPLPPIDATTAEVTTPADVYVDAICPECNLPTRILAQLSTVLETTRETGSTIKLKAKAKGRGHVHHQLPLEEADPDQQDFGLEDIVRPEDALSDDEREPDASDVDLGEGAPNDEADLADAREDQERDDAAVVTATDDVDEPDAVDAAAEAEAIHKLHVVPPPEAKGDEPDDIADLPF